MRYQEISYVSCAGSINHREDRSYVSCSLALVGFFSFSFPLSGILISCFEMWIFISSHIYRAINIFSAFVLRPNCKAAAAAAAAAASEHHSCVADASEGRERRELLVVAPVVSIIHTAVVLRYKYVLVGYSTRGPDACKSRRKYQIESDQLFFLESV